MSNDELLSLVERLLMAAQLPSKDWTEDERAAVLEARKLFENKDEPP